MDEVELLHAIMVLMAGRAPVDPVHAVFVFGRSHGDYEFGRTDEGTLHVAANLFRHGWTPYVVIPGYDGTYTNDGQRVATGYPGKDNWIIRLNALGVRKKCILATSGDGSNTKTEGDDFLQLAKAQNFTSVIVTMQPHQQLRAMLGLVQSLEQFQINLKIVPILPEYVDWKKQPVFGSQGQGNLARHQHIAWEWERIKRYQDKGDLCSYQQLHEYLRRNL